MPVLNVALLIGHTQTRRFEAIVDSGSASCLFHADIGRAYGLNIEKGQGGPLGGVIGGAKGKLYYHPVKLVIPGIGSMISITAGFSSDLAVAAILGRHGFFEHHIITFDQSLTPPGLTIDRFYRS